MGEQWVCLVCGYNLMGRGPTRCPFCGAPRESFISAGEAGERFRVRKEPVSDGVYQLLSTPRLGLEHAAYYLERERVMIDCPSVYNEAVAEGLGGLDYILYTHPHFLGAGNLFKERFGCELWLHALDAKNSLCRGLELNKSFQEEFELRTAGARHIGGHTPGFCVYLYGTSLFVCDYFFQGRPWTLNPYGPREETRAGAKKILQTARKGNFRWICGFNYAMGYRDWMGGVGQIWGLE
ncbi:MAG: MBL fold metallo-hydrolase [Euryarchaeota archaeon]|nr:MBL fold metallo-hydrolase [Euryarchaeota archaeon]